MSFPEHGACLLCLQLSPLPESPLLLPLIFGRPYGSRLRILGVTPLREFTNFHDFIQYFCKNNLQHLLPLPNCSKSWYLWPETETPTWTCFPSFAISNLLPSFWPCWDLSFGSAHYLSVLFRPHEGNEWQILSPQVQILQSKAHRRMDYIFQSQFQSL